MVLGDHGILNGAPLPQAGGALGERWGSAGGALGEPGGALGERWGSAGGALGERWGSAGGAGGAAPKTGGAAPPETGAKLETLTLFFGKSQESRAKVKDRYRKRGDYCRGFCGRWLELEQILQEASVASETSACALVAPVGSEQRD